MSGMLLGTVLLLFQAAFPFFGAEARPTKVIMLVVDSLSVAEFTGGAWPNLRTAVGEGAVGLMSTRSAGPQTPAAAHLTIGAGARARAGSLSGVTLDADAHLSGRPVAALYERMTGVSPEGSASLFLGLTQLKALATGSQDAFELGALGQELAKAGLSAVAIGNADTFAPLLDASALPVADGMPSEMRRHGALIAMDQYGRIRHGVLGFETLMEDAAWPFGHRTDYHAVWDAFVAAYAAADFIVVELGDLARLDAYADWLGHRQMENLRADSVHRIDQFIGRLLSWPPAAGQLLLVVSPSPPAAARRHGFHLAPLAVAVLPSDRGATPSEDGGGVAVTGLITSNTTRRAGIVSNTDIAPTILAALGVPTHRFSGTPMTQRPLSAFARDAPPFAAPAPDAWSAVQRMYEWATLTNSLRAPVVRTFIGFSIAVFIGWIAWMAYTSIGGGRSSAAGRAPWAPLWRWVLLLLMSVPLAVLLLPMAEPKDSPTALVVIGLVAVALTTAAFVLCGRHGTDGFVALALATAAALVVDVAAGARLIKNSVLGYDPIVAARFYGIGNEYMGVLIGTALIGTTGLLDALGRRASPADGRGRTPPSPFPLRAAVMILYAGVVVVLAAPTLGANVGGTIAAVVGFGTTTLLLLERRLTWKALAALLSTTALALAAAALADAILNEDQPSHLGKALLAFLRDGWAPITRIAVRKLSMNVTLLRWTIWAQVFVVSLGISAVALYRPGQAVRHVDRLHPNLLNGIRGSVMAALAALVANDSGVVAAATLMIPVTATLMYLMLVPRGEPDSRRGPNEE